MTTTTGTKSTCRKCLTPITQTADEPDVNPLAGGIWESDIDGSTECEATVGDHEPGGSYTQAELEAQYPGITRG